MMPMSQDLEDVVKSKKWEYIAIDKPLERQKEAFEKASKIDSVLYKGESPAYRSDGDSYESGNQVLDRMAKKSQSLQSWKGEQAYEAQKTSPRQSYTQSFEEVAKQYLSGEGKELYAHLKSKGREFYDITRVGTSDLEGAVAALAVRGDEAALLGAYDFDKRVSELASNYGVTKERATQYVMAHEFVHASQKGKYFDDHIGAELDVEHTLKEYFSLKGDYDLAAIASDRANNVVGNYGSLSSVYSAN